MESFIENSEIRLGEGTALGGPLQEEGTNGPLKGFNYGVKGVLKD